MRTNKWSAKGIHAAYSSKTRLLFSPVRAAFLLSASAISTVGSNRAPTEPSGYWSREEAPAAEGSASHEETYVGPRYAHVLYRPESAESFRYLCNGGSCDGSS